MSFFVLSIVLLECILILVKANSPRETQCAVMV